MGLDVYLYECEDWDKHLSIVNTFDSRVDSLYESVKDDAEREAAIAAIRPAGMADDNYSYSFINKVEHDSTIDPEYWWKIGYWRSAYNRGGINSALRTAGLCDLYDCCPTLNGENASEVHYAEHDWIDCRDRLAQTLEDLKNAPPYMVMCESINELAKDHRYPHSDGEARDIFVGHHLARKGSGSESYSNIDGTFFLGGMTVVGIMPGFTEALFSTRPMPCTYIIYEAKENFEHYIKQLRIAVETCDWVLAQPKPENYRLSWSG